MQVPNIHMVKYRNNFNRFGMFITYRCIQPDRCAVELLEANTCDKKF